MKQLYSNVSRPNKLILLSLRKGVIRVSDNSSVVCNQELETVETGMSYVGI